MLDMAEAELDTHPIEKSIIFKEVKAVLFIFVGV